MYTDSIDIHYIIMCITEHCLYKGNPSLPDIFIYAQKKGLEGYKPNYY